MFSRELLSSDTMKDYNRARVYLDKNYKSQEHFTVRPFILNPGRTANNSDGFRVLYRFTLGFTYRCFFEVCCLRCCFCRKLLLLLWRLWVQ